MPSGPWKDVPGYDGAYQVNDQGDVRSWKKRGVCSAVPHLLQPFMRKSGKQSRCRYVKLSDGRGKSRDVLVSQIMVRTWAGEIPEGMVVYHINGDLADNAISNLALVTRKRLGRITGGQTRRRAVAKIDSSGNAVEIYSSAREAGRRNYLSYQTVLDRCNGKVKRPFAMNGYTYRFIDEV